MYLTIDVMVLYSYIIKWNKYCFEPKNSIVAHPPCLDYTVINPCTTFLFSASHHALKDMFLRFDCCAQIWEEYGGQEYIWSSSCLGNWCKAGDPIGRKSSECRFHSTGGLGWMERVGEAASRTQIVAKWYSNNCQMIQICCLN